MQTDGGHNMNRIEFECNMSAEELKFNPCYDWWGSAFLWRGDSQGVEYNYCVECDGYNASAIYKVVVVPDVEEPDKCYLATDYDEFIHYEIDFNNPDWEAELKQAMYKALVGFFG